MVSSLDANVRLHLVNVKLGTASELCDGKYSGEERRDAGRTSRVEWRGWEKPMKRKILSESSRVSEMASRRRRNHTQTHRSTREEQNKVVERWGEKVGTAGHKTKTELRRKNQQKKENSRRFLNERNPQQKCFVVVVLLSSPSSLSFGFA